MTAKKGKRRARVTLRTGAASPQPVASPDPAGTYAPHVEAAEAVASTATSVVAPTVPNRRSMGLVEMAALEVRLGVPGRWRP